MAVHIMYNRKYLQLEEKSIYLKASVLGYYKKHYYAFKFVLWENYVFGYLNIETAKIKKIVKPTYNTKLTP